MQAGEPCRISISRTPADRRYWRVDQRGSQRSVAVALMLSVVDGKIRGGAFISTSRPYLSLFVVPRIEQDRIRWRLGTTGVSLTAAVVQDLFLSALNDDPQATRRLAPLAVYALG
jgi:hypothetical protein